MLCNILRGDFSSVRLGGFSSMRLGGFSSVRLGGFSSVRLGGFSSVRLGGFLCFRFCLCYSIIQKKKNFFGLAKALFNLHGIIHRVGFTVTFNCILHFVLAFC